MLVMDKSIKGREILYRPNEKSVEKPSGIQQVYVEPTISVPNLTEGKKMAVWIKSATLLNKSALCKESKIDRANLDKYLLRGEIPEQHIETLKMALLKYGYM